MDEKFWLPTGADGWPVARPDEALNGLSDEARRNLLDGVRANIKQLKASRLAPPLDVADAIRALRPTMLVNGLVDQNTPAPTRATAT